MFRDRSTRFRLELLRSLSVAAGLFSASPAMPPLSHSDTITTAATELPVSVEAARRALDLDDNDRDDEIRAWIREADRKLRHDARIATVNETRTRKLHQFPAEDHIVLSAVAPLSSVTSISYVDTAGTSQTLSASAYSVDTARRPGVIWLNYGYSWPATRSQPNAISIVYVAGYGAAASAVPDTAKQGILSLVRLRMDYPDEYDAAASAGLAPQGYDAAVEYLSWGSYP